jgi:hypothetical protein
MMFVRTSGSFLLSKQLMSMERIPRFPDHCENNSEPVEDSSKSNAYSTRLCILFVALGTCVFLWGLGYKLSLYGVHESSVHRVPQAKFLSRDEDAGASDRKMIGLDENHSSRLGLLFLLAAAGWFGATLAVKPNLGMRESRIPRPWASLRSADLNVFFFRPPPTF